jgi:hypothetical protein
MARSVTGGPVTGPGPGPGALAGTAHWQTPKVHLSAYDLQIGAGTCSPSTSSDSVDQVLESGSGGARPGPDASSGWTLSAVTTVTGPGPEALPVAAKPPRGVIISGSVI